jgi:hypothetical protein
MLGLKSKIVHVSEQSSYIKGGKHFYELSDYQLLKKYRYMEMMIILPVRPAPLTTPKECNMTDWSVVRLKAAHTAHSVSLRSVSTLSSHFRLGLSSGLFLLGYPTKMYTFVISPDTCYPLLI